MMPGPTLLLECPHCGAGARLRTVLSGSTLGTRVWTDGRSIAPDNPEQPNVHHCRGCQGYFWTAPARQIDKGNAFLDPSEDPYKPDDMQARWKRAAWIDEMSEAEYLEAAASKAVTSPEQELHLRLRGWWRANDGLRYGEAGEDPAVREWSSPAQANLVRLLTLLSDTEPGHVLFRAEILRELGRFDDALRALNARLPREFQPAVDHIRNLAQRKDGMVRELRRG